MEPGDAEMTAQMFDILLGDNLTGRKDYIATHGSEYLDDLDVYSETLTRKRGAAKKTAEKRKYAEDAGLYCGRG